jgi:hypothetical protein
MLHRTTVRRADLIEGTARSLELGVVSRGANFTAGGRERKRIGLGQPGTRIGNPSWELGAKARGAYLILNGTVLASSSFR